MAHECPLPPWMRRHGLPLSARAQGTWTEGARTRRRRRRWDHRPRGGRRANERESTNRDTRPGRGRRQQGRATATDERHERGVAGRCGERARRVRRKPRDGVRTLSASMPNFHAVGRDVRLADVVADWPATTCSNISGRTKQKYVPSVLFYFSQSTAAKAVRIDRFLFKETKRRIKNKN